MSAITDWQSAGLIAIALAVPGFLCFATFIAIRRLIRRQRFGRLGFAVLLCWGGVVLAMFNHDEMLRPPQPATSTPDPISIPKLRKWSF
jgi:4-amino-4-deoxy-L-arabinose transferase-like glycosyltransferase